MKSFTLYYTQISSPEPSHRLTRVNLQWFLWNQSKLITHSCFFISELKQNSVFSPGLRLKYSMRSRGYLRRFTFMLTDVLQRLSPNTTQNIKRADEKQWWSNAHKPTEQQRDIPAVYLTVLQSNLTFRGIPSFLRTNRCLVKCSRCSFLYKKH